MQGGIHCVTERNSMTCEQRQRLSELLAKCAAFDCMTRSGTQFVPSQSLQDCHAVQFQTAHVSTRRHSCLGRSVAYNKGANLPSEGTVDSMMRRPRVLASRSAFTRFTVLVVICSRMPLITMARNKRVSRSSPLNRAVVSEHDVDLIRCMYGCSQLT